MGQNPLELYHSSCQFPNTTIQLFFPVLLTRRGTALTQGFSRYFHKEGVRVQDGSYDENLYFIITLNG